MNQVINQPRPEILEKKPIDPGTIMSYEDVLKDLDQTNAVVYEDINNPQIQDQQMQQQQMQQQQIQQQQMQQQQNLQQPQMQQPQMQQQQNLQQQQIQQQMQQQQMQQQQIQQQQMQQQQMQQQQMLQQQQMQQQIHTEKYNGFIDKQIINDIIILVIIQLLLNSKFIEEMLSKNFPQIFQMETKSTMTILIKTILLVLLFYTSRYFLKKYMHQKC